VELRVERWDVEGVGGWWLRGAFHVRRDDMQISRFGVDDSCFILISSLTMY